MEKKQSQPLYSLSGYATTYHADNGDVRGLMLAGYYETDSGAHRYVNVWVSADKISFKTAKDGSPVLCIKMREISPKGERKTPKAQAKAKNENEDIDF